MANPKSWNLWHGCRKYSEGCENCYMFFLDGIRNVPEKSDAIVRTNDFYRPLEKDRKGKFKIPPGFMLTINMTSDTFLEEADNWRGEMWDIIKKRPDVIFYVLTKRVPRIRECLPPDWGDGYDNVSLSITAENQRAFDERWPIFRDISAKHKGLNLAPLLGPIDISPALESGQIEQVYLSGEGFGGTRPCRYEWMEQICSECEKHRVNFTVNSVGSVFYKNGFMYETGSQPNQARWAFKLGLTRFYGSPHYDLRSPYDGHLLSDDELMIPTYNLKRCKECPNIHFCPGCMDCGNCKDVILVDSDWNPVGPSFRRVKGKTQPTSLDDFAD